MSAPTGRRATSDPLTTLTTPVNAPAYPPPPYGFTDQEYFRISYRSDLDAARRVVPEPLTVVDPVVRFEVIRMPDSTGLGSYHGIVLDYDIGRFVGDAEAIYSYEGTREMNTLIVGRAVTGLSAFVQ